MKKLLIICLVLVGFLACKGGPKALLELKFKEGKHYGILMTTEQDISQEAQGQKIDINQSMKIGFDFDVLEVDEQGNAEIKVTYKRAAFSMTSPMGSFEYDSSNPPEEIPPPAIGFAALVDKSFTMEISSEGKIVEVKGISKLFDDIIDKMDIPSPEMKKQIASGMKKQFGEQSIKEMMGRAFNIFPGDSITVGESWQKAVKMSTGYPMVIESKYTLKSLAENEADLLVAAKLKTDPETKMMTMGPMSFEYDFTGTIDGNITVDLESGLTKSGKLNQNFTGTMKVKGGPGVKEGMEWPISVKSVITFEPL